ncbi:MAG: anaerobic ribonucleoside-triphosphate reductase activating protein [Desulfomonilaceae bacterium]
MKDDAYFGIKGYTTTSLVDWPDKICSVVFFGGCTFRCPYCHNSSLVLHPDTLEDLSVEAVLASIESRRGWIDGVTVTGGEPTARRAMPDFLSLLRQRGIPVKLDTNGSNPWLLERLIEDELVAAVYMDVKAPLDRRRYSRVAGTTVNPETIQRSIDILKRSSVEVVFRVTVVPGLVAEAEIEEIRRSLGDVDAFLVQRFRNGNTLDPTFSQLPEFSEERFQTMQARYDARRQSKQYRRPFSTRGPDACREKTPPLGATLQQAYQY